MKITPVVVAVAAATFSLGALAGGDEQQQPQTEKATPPTTEGMTDSGAVISTERTAEPKQQ